MPKDAITTFMSGLDDISKKLLDHYVDNDYVPKVRTGLGRKKNFTYEHNSRKGVEIAREILKFKKMQLKSGYITITLKSKRGSSANKTRIARNWK